MEQRQKPLIGTIQYMVLPGLGSGLNPFEIAILRSYDEEQITKLITTTVCLCTKVPFEQLFRKNRRGLLPLSRQFCTYYMRIYADMKLTRIAELLRPNDPYNHTSIMHNIQNIEHCLDSKHRYPFALQVKDFNEQIISQLKRRINESDSTNW